MSTLDGEGETGVAPTAEEGLRRRAAQGTIVNAAFLIAFAGLGLVQRVVVAKILSPSQFGLWSVVLMAVLTVLFLKNAGIGDKFVQQTEEDQERAFQKAFTIDVMLAVACVGVAAIALPLFALIYGTAGVIAPGMVLSLAIVGNSLQAPVWIYYREMNYARQRLLMSLDPGVTFVVTIVLALAGAGAWSLVVGAVCGAFSAGIVALTMSPYPIRFAWERGTVREYFAFSWPVVMAGGAGMAIAQGAQIVATRTVGLRGAGGIGLGASISGFTDGVDGIITQTLYPAICRVRDRADLLLETFVKSNRLALLWGMPFGLGIAVFAPDLVRYVLGEKWHFAVNVIAACGAVAAIDQLGFNWTAFLRALNLTRPMAWLAGVQVAAFFLITVPLFIAFGMNGFAIGWLALGAATVGSRTYYLKRLFPGFSMVRHALRSIAPSVPAVGAVLLMKALISGPQTLAHALAELAVYTVVTVLASIVFERALLVEMLGYLLPSQGRYSASSLTRRAGTPA